MRHRSNIRGTSRSARTAVAVGLVVMISGCVDARRFDAEMRGRCFDVLWAKLKAEHVNVSAVRELESVAADARRRVAAAPTRREYLVELARFVAPLDDAHLHFTNLDSYWQRQTGAVPTGITTSLIFWDGGFWMLLPLDGLSRPPPTEARGDSRSAGASRAGPPGTSRPGQGYRRLLAVEGVPASHIALDLLRGAPGSEIGVTVEGARGEPERVRLRCPETTSAPSARRKQPSSRPASQPAGQAQNLGKRLADDIGLIRVPSVEAEVVPAFDRALRSLADTRALVLDLTGNVGGELGPLERILGHFVDRPTVYGAVDYPVPRLLPLGPPRWVWRNLRAVFPRRPIYRKPVVVIVGGTSMSCAEMLAFALHDTVGATLIGQRTLGAGSIYGTVKLPDGLEMSFGKGLVQRLDGRPIERTGVDPDIAVRGLLPDELNQDWGWLALSIAQADLLARAVNEARRQAGLPAWQPPTTQSASTTRPVAAGGE